MTATPEDLRLLALNLRDFLVKFHRVRDIEGPTPVDADWREWDIRFTHKGFRRHYHYHVQRPDPFRTMYQALRADTNGELLVRVPSERDLGLLTNSIFYPPHG